MATTESIRAKIVEQKLELLKGKMRTARWLADNDAPDVDWIVQGAIEAGGFATIFGDSGIGKTFLAMHLANCIARGKSWFGHEILTPRKVLYLDAENGEGVIHRRAKMINPSGEGDLIYVSFPGLVLNTQGLGLLHRLVDTERLDMLFIDPLMYFEHGDENVIKDMRPQLQGLRTLSDNTGVGIVAVHHENKAKGYRGSTAHKDTATLMLHLSEDILLRSTEFEHVLNIIPVKQRLATMKRFSIAWYIEGGSFHVGTLSTMRESPASKIVAACTELMRENAQWPGKTKLIRAKDYHGLSQRRAQEALAQAIKDNDLDYVQGRHNRWEVKIAEV